METGTRHIRQKRRFNVGSFNIRGLTEDANKNELVRDVNKFVIDVFPLQETKIKNAGVQESMEVLSSLDSKNKHCGNGFVVPNKWQESIHK